ncbi:MAG: xanthine dehydrogenase family protein molybdopterin-binding subunit, partial [Candidatus Marinimicrobia bacterium]|nr:xanthine dehydrogenase family protein molybdopterin-binding subunit [Candidatus Neomarinimicrobiota bacterium]
MHGHATLSRKEFLNLSATVGAGLVIGFHLLPKQLMGKADAPSAFEPNVWISINRDGTTSIVMHRCEMGQKIVTTLPMIVAEELDADWSMVKVVRANYNPAYGPQNTGGSASIRTTYDKLRKAGAAAREMLITAAAQTWNVPRSQCRTENGRVVHRGNGKILSYGDLVTAASKLDIPEEVPLNKPADFSIIGTDNMLSKDGRIKVNGDIHYGLDFTMEGMLTSVIARCPVFGGQPGRWNQKAALAVAGVRHVVQVSAGIAVVADDTWSALQGRKALDVEWDEGPGAALSSDEISKLFREKADSKGEVLRDDGDVPRALKDARRTVEAVYELPYLDHAPMEPMNCTARVHDGICEVWAPTQTPGNAHEVARELTGLPGDKVKINILYIGGAFGRRLQTDFVRDAVEVALKVPAPVKVMRTRGEDLQHGFYRPASYHVLRGGIGRKKAAVAWSHRLVYPDGAWVTGGAADINYAIPNVYVDH